MTERQVKVDLDISTDAAAQTVARGMVGTTMLLSVSARVMVNSHEALEAAINSIGLAAGGLALDLPILRGLPQRPPEQDSDIVDAEVVDDDDDEDPEI